MKKLAAAVGLLIILLVGAAVMLPRYIDWNALKPEIAAAAERLTGHAIAIDGKVGVALLPKPALTATGVRLAAAADMPEPLRVATLELRLAPLALLFGELRFERLHLIGPEILVVRDANGGHNWSWLTAPEGREGRGQLSLDDVAVDGGTVIYRNAEGTEWRVSELNLVAAAQSLAGPISTDGRFLVAGLPVEFALRLGRRGADGRLPVSRFTLGLVDGAARLNFRGSLAGNGENERVSGELSLNSRDLSRTAGVLGLPIALAPLPAALRAQLQATGSEAALNQIAIRLAGAQLNGAVHASFGKRLHLDGVLTAGRFDLDALLPPPGQRGEKAAAAETAGLRWPDWHPPAHLSGALDLSIEGLGWRQAVLRQVQLSAKLADGRLRVESARALMPGGSSLSLSGGLTTGDGGPRFDGHLELQSGNLERLLAWLGLAPGGIVKDRLANLSLATDFSLTPALLQTRETTLRLNGTSATGALTYRMQGRPSFGLDLSLDRLDLDDYLPSLTAPPDDPLALLQRFDSNLKLTAGRLRWGGTALNGVALDLGLVQGQLTVREARIADLAGSKLTLHASAGGFDRTPTYIGDLQVASADPVALIEALGLPAPGGSPDLGPLTFDGRLEGEGSDLSLQATGRLGESGYDIEGKIASLTGQPELDLSGRLADVPLGQVAAALDFELPQAARKSVPMSLNARLSGTLQPLALALDGEVAGARFEIRGEVGATATPTNFDLAIKGEHQDAAELFERLGLGGGAGAAKGALALSARLRRDSEIVRLDDIALSLGPSRLVGAVAVVAAEPRPRIEGELGVDRLDLARWLEAFAIGQGDAEEPAAADALDFIGRYDGRLRIDAGTLAYGPTSLHDVAAMLTFERGIFGVEELKGRLFGGSATLSGRIVAGQPAALDLVATLEEANLQRTLEAVLGTTAVTGRVSLAVELQSIGVNLEALARNLGGSLELEAADGVVRGLGLAGLDRTIAPGMRMEDATGLVAGALATGRTPLVAAQGRWRLGSGVLATDNSRVSLEGGEARLSGEIELGTRRLDLRLELQPNALPQAPAIIVGLRGRASAPEVRLDTAAFSNYLRRRSGEETPGADRRSAP